MKFKKILATVGSVLMLSSVIGGAFAAGLPTTLKADNTVIVQGTGSNDANAINTLKVELSRGAEGAVPVDGDNSFALERGYDKFTLGKNLDSIYQILDDENMKTFLASGKYRDTNRVEMDYEQNIELSDAQLTFFKDKDYNDNTPSIGFHFDGSKKPILNYSITFDKIDSSNNFTNITDTEIPFMGRTYYVLSSDNTSMRLMDSSNTVTVMEDESASSKVGDKDYTIEVGSVGSETIGNNDVQFAEIRVNGEDLGKFYIGDKPIKLNDGAYIALKEITIPRQDAKAGKVQVILGKGDLELSNTKEVKLGSETLKGVRSYVDSSSGKITIEWSTDKEEFLTAEKDTLVIPGFNAIKLVFNEMEFPNAEITTLDAGSTISIDTEVKDGNVKVPLFTYNRSLSSDNGNFTSELGGEDQKLVTVDNVLTTNLTLKEGDFFVATYESLDGKEYGSYVLELNDVKDDEGKNVTTLRNLADGSDLIFSNTGKDRTLANRLKISINATDEDAGTATIQVSGVGGSIVSTTKLITSRGLTIELPNEAVATNLTTEGDQLSWTTTLTEADREGSVGEGKNFTVTIAPTDSDEDSVEVTSVNKGNADLVDWETSTKNVHQGYIYSDLATSYTLDRSGKNNDLEISYYGEEVSAKVVVASTSVSSVPGEAGDLIVADTDAAKMSGKNLIVVGGSAINSVAARLLGFDGPAYGEDFTEKTGVSAGEYLIQSFDKDDGKVAIVVAGYNADDTEKGAKFLANKDYVVGKKYKGTTADVAQEVTA